MLEQYLSIVSLKDFMLRRVEKNGDGSLAIDVVEAGTGMTDFSDVFSTVSRLGFSGPLSAHCEFKIPKDGLLAGIKREIAFFNKLRAEIAHKE